jgi:hypothetical protein
VFNSKRSKVFGAKDLFKKDVVEQKQFLQDLAFWLLKIISPSNLLEALG